jgi:CheY-like chemotaxis protein
MILNEKKMGKTIVIVDDDQDDIDILTEAIVGVDKTAACFAYIDCEEAMDNLINKLILLPTHIFLDINMPKLTGDKCLERIKEDSAFNDSLIIILSTGMLFEDSEKFKKLGADFTFAKPVSMLEYQRILEQIFRASANY